MTETVNLAARLRQLVFNAESRDSSNNEEAQVHCIVRHYIFAKFDLCAPPAVLP